MQAISKKKNIIANIRNALYTYSQKYYKHILAENHKFINVDYPPNLF